ncbi:hypothetical protein ACFE04_024729 [Oxalis oulophora]
MFQSLTLAASSTVSASFPRQRTTIPRVQTRVKAVAMESPPTSRLSTNNDLYEVLKLSYDATATEIKTAYRSLAKIYHPDGGQSIDGSDFIEIHKAYATLSDPAARKLYDLSIGVGLQQSYRNHRMTSSFGFYSTRNWETDQCW